METSAKISVDSPGKMLPGGFGRRFVAVIIDGVIVGIATLPIAFIGGIIIALVASGNEALINVFSQVLNFVAIWFYYGYFYSTKGATPGKMVMKLRVINTNTGKNLTYGQAFLRETIGRLISTLPIFAGYFVVLFRDDRKAFHDMLFNSQVLHQQD